MQIEQPSNPIDLSLITPPRQPITQDDRAQVERDRLFGESQREQELKWTIHKAIKFFIWFVASIGCVLALVRAVHFVIPEKWFWLNANQLQTLDTIAKYLISSAVGGLFIKYINKGVEDS